MSSKCPLSKEGFVNFKYFVLLLAIGLTAGTYFLFLPKKTGGANLTSVSVTMSDPRLSYYANQYGTVAGGTIITIGNTAGENQGPSTTNNNLFPGETVLLGNAGTARTYTVADIIDDASDDRIQLTGPIQSGDGDNGDVVIASRSATLTTALTTVSMIPNGAFRFRVKAGANNSTNKDGIPDQDGFDFVSTSSPPTITCPANGAGFTFVTGTATASGSTGCASGYHCFECRYSGVGSTAASLTFVANANSKMINPAPASGHTEGTADSYKVLVEQLDSGNNIIDAVTTSLAVVESVRVTATVDPILNFTIGGKSSASTYCSTASANITTTATTVPLGTLSISAFTDGTHQLTVSTNADGGYSVVAWEYDQLGKDGNTCSGKGPTFANPCIRDTLCDNGGCSESTEREWVRPDVANAKGFGYSLTNIDAASITFTSTGNCWGGSAGKFCSRQFADYDRNSSPETAATLFSSTTVADSEDIYVCYRAVISTVQEAGDYETYITYRATATF